MTDETEYDNIEIKLYDKRILKFVGIKLAEESDGWINGREQTRWHELTLYKIQGTGHYLLYKEYHTRWQGESGDDSYQQFESVEELHSYAQSQDWDLLYKLLNKAGIPIIIQL